MRVIVSLGNLKIAGCGDEMWCVAGWQTHKRTKEPHHINIGYHTE